MNKYQEALELLKEDHISNELNTVDKINHNARLGKIIDLLQELVDKATPKKPIGIVNYEECPVCKVVVLDKYCYECGQLLDWSKDE